MALVSMSRGITGPGPTGTITVHALAPCLSDRRTGSRVEFNARTVRQLVLPPIGSDEPSDGHRPPSSRTSLSGDYAKNVVARLSGAAKANGHRRIPHWRP